MVVLLGFGELVSGILFILGVFFLFGVVIIIIIMLGVIVKVYGVKGFVNGVGGYEYNVVLIVVFIGVVFIGLGVYVLYF